jgi:hypothetical protein
MENDLHFCDKFGCRERMGGAASVPGTSEGIMNGDTLKDSFPKALIPPTPLEQSRGEQKLASVSEKAAGGVFSEDERGRGGTGPILIARKEMIPFHSARD